MIDAKQAILDEINNQNTAQRRAVREWDKHAPFCPMFFANPDFDLDMQDILDSGRGKCIGEYCAWWDGEDLACGKRK